jgi:hypothetical protein
MSIKKEFDEFFEDMIDIYIKKFFSRPEGILEDLEEKVSEWHRSDTERSLHEWLDMDTEEYNCYLKGEGDWLKFKMEKR